MKKRAGHVHNVGKFSDFGSNTDNDSDRTGAADSRHCNGEEGIIVLVAAHNRCTALITGAEKHLVADDPDNKTAGNTKRSIRDAEEDEQQVTCRQAH